MPGPTPKPARTRRRANTPKTWGAATPITAPAAEAQDRELGIENPHPLVERMWATVQSSAEARFYSPADWARLQMELWYANTLLCSGKPIGANAWTQVQRGLNAMLISPAEKRRAAIELKPVGPDADRDAAVSMMSTYKAKLKPV